MGPKTPKPHKYENKLIEIVNVLFFKCTNIIKEIIKLIIE